MSIQQQLLFFFSAIGAFNSSLLSVYFLLFVKTKNLSNYLLGCLLAALSIRIWKSIFFYFNPDLSKIYLQIGLSACFFIGPLLYIFLKSRITPNSDKQKQWVWLLLLSVLIITLIGVWYPYSSYPKFWSGTMYKIINYQWLFFLTASAYILKTTWKRFWNKNEKLTFYDVLNLSVFLGVALIWLAYFTASYTSYIMGALSFSFALYLSIILFYQQQKQYGTSSGRKEKYAQSKIKPTQATPLLADLEQLLKTEKLYTNPNLTLAEVAMQLNISPHLLSQLLNDNMGKNFSQYINEFRIEEAKVLLSKNKHFKMEIIAENCGFNSNSTFYSAFKKITDTTPAKFANGSF